MELSRLLLYDPPILPVRYAVVERDRALGRQGAQCAQPLVQTRVERLHDGGTIMGECGDNTRQVLFARVTLVGLLLDTLMQPIGEAQPPEMLASKERMPIKSPGSLGVSDGQSLGNESIV